MNMQRNTVMYMAVSMDSMEKVQYVSNNKSIN